jgi:phosphate transport system substrate-binding protein
VVHIRQRYWPKAGRAGVWRGLVLLCQLALFLAITLLLAACDPQTNDALTLTGSTSVTPFAERLAELYQRAHPGTAINIQGLGSSAGIRATLDGVAEIGMSSRDLKPDEAALLDQVVIARDALAVIVNPANPVTALSRDQILSIFARPSGSWAALGGSEQPIVVVSREAGSGTFSAFEDLVMKGTPISSAALRQGSNGAIRQIVAGDPQAIGYISLGIVDQTVKALMIDGVRPSAEHVEAGTYRLARPFLLVWRKDQPLTPLARSFIDYVVGPEGQAELARAGLVKGAPPR